MKCKNALWLLALLSANAVAAAPNVDAALSYLGKARAFLVANSKLPNDVAGARARMAEAQQLEAAGLKLFGSPKFGEPFFNCWAFSSSVPGLAGDQNNMVRNSKADAFAVYSVSSGSFQAGTLYTECLFELDALLPKGKGKILDLSVQASKK